MDKYRRVNKWWEDKERECAFCHSKLSVKYDVPHEDVVGVSYDELANADDIVPDDVVFNHYDGVVFSDDDFFCGVD